MINVVICDDTVQVCDETKVMLEQLAHKKQIVFRYYIFHSGEELLKNYGKQYDIIIMDIEMAGMDGLETAEKIRDMDEQVRIIFSTRYSEHAASSYDVNASGYFIKPLEYQKVEKGISKILLELEKRNKEILIQFNGNVRNIKICNILYIESYQHKLTYHLMDGSKEHEMRTLKEVMEEDKEQLLLAVHKSVVVNKIWIEYYKEHRIYLKGVKDGIVVSRPRRKYVEQEYLKYCREQLE